MIFCVLTAVLVALLSCEAMRTLQCGSYRLSRGYFKVVLTAYFAILVLTDAVNGVLWLVGASKWWSLLPIAVATAVVLSRKRKVPLVVTKRVIRLAVTEVLLAWVWCTWVSRFWVVTVPLLTIFAHVVNLPMEMAINRYYIGRARRKIKNSGAKVIAVTGSYGKTSVKKMLACLLPDSVATSGSYNTALGIAKFVNSTDLDGVKYVILEYGARQKGDVKRLCKLYGADYGIVTGVAPQHLKTFKTLQNVVATKRELVEQIGESGACVLNDFDENVREFATVGESIKLLASNVQISGLKVEKYSTICDIVYQKWQFHAVFDCFSLATVKNFALCLPLCYHLGVPLKAVKTGIKKVKSVPHRMQLIRRGDFFILDDSYNASVEGVKNCAETLALVSAVKVAVLQGIAEAGSQAYEQNVFVGKTMGDVCDVCVVLGKNSVALSDGLLQTRCHVLHANNLADATRSVQKYLVGGAVLVFQNDLPDNVNL